MSGAPLHPPPGASPVTDPALPPVRAAVLIGGAGRRMGRSKHDVDLAGRSMLAWVVGALTEAGLGVSLVGGAKQLDEFPELSRISDVPELRGPPAGICAALESDAHSAWLVVACDLPLVSSAAVRWVLAQRTNGRIAVMPRVSAERVEPLLACYEPASARWIAEIGARRGGRLQELATRDDVLAPAPPMDLRCAWQNINTPHDLEVARVMIAGRTGK